MVLIRILTFFALLAAGNAAGAQPSSHWLEEARRDIGAPGLAFAVWREGRIVEGAAGERALGSGVAVLPRDPFHIGSITKPVTATLAARLVEQGLLSWTDTIGERLAGIDIHPAYLGLTLAHLLSHRAGIAPDAHPQETAQLARIRSLGERRARAAALILALPPAAAPGRSYLYSNYSYLVAAVMMEQATGRSWEQLVREDVLAPLGLTSAGFGPPGSASLVDAPWGHIAPGTLVSGPVSPNSPLADNPPFRAPAGGLHMSMRDLALFGAAHLLGEAGEEVSFLSTGTWRFLHARHPGAQATGWALGEGGSLHHDGSNLRWFALLRVIPEERLVIAIAANAANDLDRSRRAFWRLSEQLRRTMR
jgi:CubicO group peptidase (beta-lactamase class C family)